MRSSPAASRVSSAVLTLTALFFVGLMIAGPAGRARGQSASAPPAVSRDEAVSLVVRAELGGSLDGVRLFVLPRPLSAGESVRAWHREVFTAPASGWLVFVDLHPGANWEHPCLYYFVHDATGEVRRHEATTPPLILAELTEVTSGRDNPPPGVSEAELSRFSERLRALPKPQPPTRGQAWAFLISGGANQGNNHIRYWNDCAFIYRALVEYYGYTDDHIRVCVSDGTNPAADRSDGTNSPADLDGDGDADIEYPATLAYVGQVFGELAAAVNPTDQLFIFTTDHGGQESGQDCYLNLWNNETLPDQQMAAYVAALPCQTIVCTFEQCYSGGMIDDLSADGRVIATAARWDELSWAMGPDYIYDTFVYHWTCAVGWQTPSGAPVDADTNDDGLVSMHEAFLYAQANDHESETPQYDSVPVGLGDGVFLFGNLEGVYLAVEQIGIDDDDSGASHGDGDGVIDFGETVELTVTLFNMGMTAALGVTGTLATSSPYVTVLAGDGEFGDIPSEGTGSNTAPFVIGLAPDIPDGEPLGLSLAVTEEPGTLSLDLAAAAPEYAVLLVNIDDTNGDADGVADPGESVWLSLLIENTGGSCSPLLTSQLQSGGYFTADGIPHEIGAIPAGQSAYVDGGVVTISPDCPPIYSGHLILGLTAPEGYAASPDLLLPVGPWFDDAEAENGWTLGAPDDNATTGLWVRADPVGTVYNGQPAQTEDDHTVAPGQVCFVTGNGSVGGAAGEQDVDGGKTTLISPPFFVQGATSATLTYWRWYTNHLGNNPGADWWDVDVSPDGTSWVHLEHTQASANAWTEQSFSLGEFVPLAGSVRLRFVADDTSPGSLVEAAVDDISVLIIRPPAAGLEEDAAARPLGLGRCLPNPVRSEATLSLRLAVRSPVRIDLYNVSGRRVKTLLQGSAEAGEHLLRFAAVGADGRPLPSGVYFLRMQTPEFVHLRQVAVLR